jgi:hypothetical protein
VNNLIVIAATFFILMFPLQGLTDDRMTSRQLQGAVAPSSSIGGFASKPKGPVEYSCTAGAGCNCWGNEDCNKLVQSGKCHGNPLKCDPVNPNSCHCD